MTREETHYEVYLRERAEHAEARAEKAEAAIRRVRDLAGTVVFPPMNVDAAAYSQGLDYAYRLMCRALDGDK